MTRIRIGAAAAAAAVLLGLIGARVHAADDTAVTVVDFGGSWQEAERKAIFIPAYEKLGLTLKEDSLKTIADIRLQVQSGSPTWDVVALPIGECVAGEKEALFEPIDYATVTNSKDLDPSLNAKTYTGGTVWSSFVIAWSKKKYGDNPPKSWADFFDTKKFPGARSAYNAPRFMLEAALLADGVEKDKIYPMDLDRAFKKLRSVKKDIAIWYTSFGQAVELIKNGEVDMLPLLDGRIIDVIKDGGDWGFTYNQGVINGSCLAVVKGASHKANAMKVINTFLDPQIQARIPQFFSYGPINSKAYATGLIDDAVARKLNSYPDNLKAQLILDPLWWGDHRSEAQLRWDEFMAQ
jgi:putative spermidine/putrescine transport system substrate-binding protein